MTHEDVSASYLHSSLVILSSLISEGHFSYVFRGQSGTTSMIGKLARNVSQANLRAEFLVYQRLSPLQGTVIPRYFGLFNVQNLGLLLLLEDCGQSICAFDELSNRQKLVFYISWVLGYRHLPTTLQQGHVNRPYVYDSQVRDLSR
jgi:hypothetical protein